MYWVMGVEPNLETLMFGNYPSYNMYKTLRLIPMPCQLQKWLYNHQWPFIHLFIHSFDCLFVCLSVCPLVSQWLKPLKDAYRVLNMKFILTSTWKQSNRVLCVVIQVDFTEHSVWYLKGCLQSTEHVVYSAKYLKHTEYSV